MGALLILFIQIALWRDFLFYWQSSARIQTLWDVLCCGGVLGHHVCEGRSVQNLVSAPRMGSSLMHNPDQTKTSMTVTCRLWEELICAAPCILLGQVTGHQLLHRCSFNEASLGMGLDCRHPGPVWLWQMSINRVFSQVFFPAAG